MPKKSEQIQARLNKAEADARALKRALAEAKREEKREAKAAQRKRDQQTGLSLVAELRAPVPRVEARGRPHGPQRTFYGSERSERTEKVPFAPNKFRPLCGRVGATHGADAPCVDSAPGIRRER